LQSPGASAIGNQLALPIFVVLVVLAGYVGWSQVDYGERSSALDAHLASFRQQRWERPVLRGLGSEGNAAAEAWAALDGFAGLSDADRDALALSLYVHEPLSDAQRALLSTHAARIDAVRAATRRTWSMAELPLEQGLRMSAPPFPRAVDAALLVLAHGTLQEPDACLEAAADAARFGQDLVPGAPLEAFSVATRIASLASPVAARCAQDASQSAMLRAAHEFHVMAKTPPSIGLGVELHDLLLLSELRDRANLFSKHGGASAWARVRSRPSLYEAWKYFDRPSRWRSLQSTGYPEALATWRREHEWRARATAPLVARESEGVLGWIYDDMRGQALLRAMAVGLATLADRTRQGRIPENPIGLSDPALRDPFSGRTLRWRVAQDGTEITLWAVGEDLRDDRGTDEWGPQAPLDAVMHVGFPPLTAAKSAARSTQRRHWLRANR
jgi:hypothetical protein